MGDRFYITLSESDKNRVQEILSAGQFSNAGDIIRDGIALSHRRLKICRDANNQLRSGLVSLSERLERFNKSEVR